MAGRHAQRGKGVNVLEKIDTWWRAVRPGASPHFDRHHCPNGRRRADYWDFIWVVYSIFFFIEPFNRHSRRYWLEFACFYAIFLALYSGIVLARHRWQSYACIASMAVLGIAYYPQNSGAFGCSIFAAAFLPFVAESLAICLGGIALLTASLVIEGILLHRSPWSWGMGVLFTVIVGGTNLFMAQRLRANSKLQLAHEEIEQLAKVAERERIARDLHDVLGHTLSVIVLKSELAGRLLSTNPQRSAAEMADVESIARKALSEVREAISGYRAEGLTAEIQRARGTLDAAGVTLVCEAQPPALNPSEETVMALAVREAVTNVVRHAQASQCIMRFITQHGRTVLVVEDNGRGGAREDGNGLRGMRERIEALGGSFAIDGSQGTRLTIELPLKQLAASS
jgi:two-component system sensor histidine kinase DesK